MSLSHQFRDIQVSTPTNGTGGTAVGAPELPRTFLSYLMLFWAKRRVLLKAAAYSAVASILLAFIIPVRYQAVTRLMPPDGQSAGGLGLLAAMAERGGMSSLGGVAGDLLGMKSSGALFVGILNSDTVRDAVVQKFDLQKVYHVSTIEDARKELAQRADISEDRKSGVISIGVTDHDPRRAAGIAQEYVAELDRLVAQVSTSSARRERIFLEARLQAVKNDLDTASKNFSDFASKNTAIDIPAQGKAMVTAAATLQGEVIAAQSELSSLQQIYSNNNIRVRAAQARVSELQKKLDEIGGAGTQQQLQSDTSIYPSIRKLPLLGVTYADLYREMKTQETVYELLTQQYELAKMQEAKEIPVVKVLDPALVPTKKSFPPRSVITTLCTMLGIAFTMVWIVGKTRWDAIDAAEPNKRFAIEVFTTLRARILRLARNSPTFARGEKQEESSPSEGLVNTDREAETEVARR